MNEKEIQKYIKNLIILQSVGDRPDGKKMSEFDHQRFAEEIRIMQGFIRMDQSRKVKTRGSLECKMPLRITPSKAWNKGKLPRTTDINTENF